MRARAESTVRGVGGKEIVSGVGGEAVGDDDGDEDEDEDFDFCEA